MMVDITPEKCETCKGKGSEPSPFKDGGPIPCLDCLGRGFLYPPALVERIADLIALAIYNNSIDLVDQWTRDKSRSLTREILDALNTEPA